jgi:peptidoglycan hydrolase CwlO-like protein
MQQAPAAQAQKKLEELTQPELALLSVRCLVSTNQLLAQLVKLTEVRGQQAAKEIELLEEICELLTDDDDDDDERKEAAPPYAEHQRADLQTSGLAPRFTERVEETDDDDENAEFRAMCTPNPDYRP